MKTNQVAQFLRFAVVGGIGFIIDGGLLWFLLTYGVDTYLARVFSFPIAVIATWWLNRIWTFSSARKASPGKQLNFYLTVQITGALSNYLMYILTVQTFGTDRLVAIIGFVLGSFVGMFINFSGARYVVFRQ